MHKVVKGTIIFVGGMCVGAVYGGMFVIDKCLSDEYLRRALSYKMTDKLDEWLFGDAKGECDA